MYFLVKETGADLT